MTLSKNKFDEDDLQFLRETAEEIYAYLDGLGGDLAVKSRRLRHINSRLIWAAANMPGYYSKFSQPLEAVLVYLFLSGEPRHKKAITKDIVAGGLEGGEDGPQKAIRDSLYYQTKPANNGKFQVEDSGDGIISLTESGIEQAKKLILKHGNPAPASES